jgi:hypothetical protein
MRPKLQKQSALKLAGRIIPGAKRRGKTNGMKLEAQVKLSNSLWLLGIIPEAQRSGIDTHY